MSDWIKVHRRLLDSDVFANPNTLKVWVWLLLKANYKDRILSLRTGRGSEDVLIKRGRVLFGRKTAAKELKLSESAAYRNIKKLESLGKISVKANTHYSIITICKYELYQSITDTDRTANEQQTNSKRTANEQQVNTPKKDKNIQEGKESKEFNKMPLPENFNGLPDIKVGAVVELMKILKQVDVSKEQVLGLWSVFKVQTLTGKKFYADEDAVYSHFINWSKTQNVTPASISVGSSSLKSKSQQELQAEMDAWLNED
jgi:hypothetical protein